MFLVSNSCSFYQFNFEYTNMKCVSKLSKFLINKYNNNNNTYLLINPKIVLNLVSEIFEEKK